MKALVLLVVMLLSLSVYAHDPTEITYVFEEDELTIHLTPKGALDLISFIIPRLTEQESIHLTSYIQEYEDYFNNRIDIKSSGRSIGLAYSMSDLTKHDSFIRFRLLNFDKDYSTTIIVVSAFEGVYQHVSNKVILPQWSSRGATNISDATAFRVLKEKFIECENPFWGYMLSFCLIAAVFSIVVLIIWVIGRLLGTNFRK